MRDKKKSGTCLSSMHFGSAERGVRIDYQWSAVSKTNRAARVAAGASPNKRCIPSLEGPCRSRGSFQGPRYTTPHRNVPMVLVTHSSRRTDCSSQNDARNTPWPGESNIRPREKKRIIKMVARDPAWTFRFLHICSMILYF